VFWLFRIAALAAMLATVGLTCTGQSKSPGAPEQRVPKQNGAINAGNDAARKQDQDAAPNVTVIVNNQGQTPNTKDGGDKDDADIEVERSLAKFTEWLVVVGIIQFLALCMHAFIFWRQATIMEEHRTSLVALAESAGHNAAAARASAEAVVTAERAWTSVRPMVREPELYSVPEVGDPITQTFRNVFAVSVKNVGRTPALVTKSVLLYVRVDDLSQLAAEPAYTEPDIQIHDGLLLFPDGEPIGRVAFLQPEAILSKAQVAAIQNKEGFVYAYGFIEYRDAFECPRCPHRTQFGYVYNFPQGGEPQVLKGFMPGGPDSYNKST